MGLNKIFSIWCKYQLSLNWLNILFRYSIKLLLLLNVIIIVVGITYKFKHAISQFTFLMIGLAFADLLLKIKFKKHRQDLHAFHLIPNGVIFLSILNILQDILSPRNLILPLLATIILAIIGQQIYLSVFYLLVLSFVNNIVAGLENKKKMPIAVIIAVGLTFITLYFQLSIGLTSTCIMLGFIILLYQRYGEKQYPEENTLNPRQTISIYNISNPYFWLDVQTFKKSRHLQLTFIKLITLCLVYCYIIYMNYNHQQKFGFDLILLIQINYALVPALLIPYILGSNHSYIGLLMTLPNLKTFFMTKLNIILFIQFLLTLTIFGLNYNNIQILFLTGSIFIFNVYIVTPILFMGILYTDEKVNIFDSGVNNILFIPPFVQSMYFLGVLVGTAVILYLLQYFSLNNFSLLLIGLSTIAFFLKERFFRFFHLQYCSKKYKLYNILH